MRFNLSIIYRTKMLKLQMPLHSIAIKLYSWNRIVPYISLLNNLMPSIFRA